MPLHYQSRFHRDLANLCKRLRYILGGIRPRQTTHQILSSDRFHGLRVRIKNIQGWYLTVARRLPPMLNRYIPNSISSCSKASRGLFVRPWVTGIFTGLAISPSPSLRQSSNCYAIRAGRNSPDKEFRYLRTVIVTAGVRQRFGSPREGVPLTF